MTKAASAASIAPSPRRCCATRRRAWTFLLGVGLATLAACALFYTEASP